MAQLPMFCDSCGAMSLTPLDFAPMTLFGGEISIECPSCGTGRARVPEGAYDIEEESFTLLAGPDRTVEQLKRFAEIIRRAQREEYSAEQVRAAVEREVPELAQVARRLPKDRGQLYSVLNFWLTLIGILAAGGYSIASYRQSERHHREAMEAAAQQPRRSDAELDELLRRIQAAEAKLDSAASTKPRSDPIKAEQSKGATRDTSQAKVGESHMNYRNETFEGREVLLDGNTFEGCTFRDCQLIYRGMELPLLIRCKLHNIHWTFEGPAHNTIEMLRGWYHGMGEAGKALVESIFEEIRRRKPGPA